MDNTPETLEVPAAEPVVTVEETVTPATEAPTE